MVEAIKKKPDSSIVRAVAMVASGEAGAAISAGNTGAMVAGGLFLKRFLSSVRRPGIAAGEDHGTPPPGMELPAPVPASPDLDPVEGYLVSGREVESRLLAPEDEGNLSGPI